MCLVAVTGYLNLPRLLVRTSMREARKRPARRKYKKWMVLEFCCARSLFRITDKSMHHVSTVQLLNTSQLKTYTAKQARLKSSAASLSIQSSGIGGACASLYNFTTTAIASASYHGRFPVNISMKVHPRDQISIFALYPRSRGLTTSGAIQNMFPVIAVIIAYSSESSRRSDRPKSDILQTPVASTMT